MDARQALREVLVANLFDGDDGGTVTAPIAKLVDDIVEILAEQGYTVTPKEPQTTPIFGDAPDLRAAVYALDRYAGDQPDPLGMFVHLQDAVALADAHRCIPDEATLTGPSNAELLRWFDRTEAYPRLRAAIREVLTGEAKP